MTTLATHSSPPCVTSIAYQGQEYPTAAMTIFPTSQSCLPFVFLTADGIFFLQTHRAQWEAPRVRRIPRHEANRIATLYNVEALKQTLAQSPISPGGIAQNNIPTDAELIKQINQLTPEQLDKLSGVLQAAGLK